MRDAPADSVLSDATPSFALMDVQGPVIVTYVYQLVEGEVSCEVSSNSVFAHVFVSGRLRSTPHPRSMWDVRRGGYPATSLQHRASRPFPFVPRPTFRSRRVTDPLIRLDRH
jgi:hypothetical protein